VDAPAGGYLGLDLGGALGLAVRLAAAAYEVDALARQAAATLAGLHLGPAAGPRFHDLLARMSDDDRRAAGVLRRAHHRAAGFTLAGLPPAALSGRTARRDRAELEAAAWHRWAPGGGAGTGDGDAVVVIDATGDGRASWISVEVDGDELVVDIDGRELRMPRAPAGLLVVRAGAGHDVVRVASGPDLQVLVLGGDGDDDIRLGSGRDVVLAGRGADYVDAGAGADTVVGGTGHDVIYGMDGADLLLGGAGEDHLDGAGGHDVLWGGGDHDVLAGGTGADRTVAAGRDHIVDGGSPAGVGVPGWRIAVDGDGPFVARVRADLATLRGTAAGRELLEAVDAAFAAGRQDGRLGPLNLGASDGHRVTIVETDRENGYASTESNRFFAGPPGSDATVSFNPGFHISHLPGGGTTRAAGPPVVVLFHELVHAWTFQTGTDAPGTYRGPGPDGPLPGQPDIANVERQATGLPIDHDDDLRTPEVPTPGHPSSLTENALRAELGLAARNTYRTVVPPAARRPPSDAAEPEDGRARRHRRGRFGTRRGGAG
jgi:hypothetical protein